MQKRYIITAVVFLFACEKSPTERTKVDIDMAELFAAATETEIGLIEDDWLTRVIAAPAITLLLSDTIMISNVQTHLEIISHDVDIIKHVGAFITPLAGLGTYSNILVYLHGGDAGVTIFEVQLILASMAIDLSNTLLVVPSFRNESIYHEAIFYVSTGDPSPWDRDVDDALVLLNAAIDYKSITGSPKIVLFGMSRGAGVGLLMAIRDPQITGIAEFFGPTDFFDEFVRDVADEAFAGSPRDLPGLDYITDNFLIPLQYGDIGIPEVRLEMVRRSPVLFADRLPTLQIHHGQNDTTVYVSQAESLINALEALGASAPVYEATIYAVGGHSPFELVGSLTTAGQFIESLFTPIIAAGSGARFNAYTEELVHK